MQRSTAARLLRLNRDFYDQFAGEFSDSRAALPPGILRALALLGNCRSLLDLGCGDGRIGRALAGQNRITRYRGVDFSAGLLGLAGNEQEFVRADLSRPGWSVALGTDLFDGITCLATLHHLPGTRRRARFLREMRERLAPGGVAIISVWRFMHVPRLKKKIVPWSEIDLTADDVDPGDFLLDWRRGGRGLRYVHHFEEEELTGLCRRAGYRIDDRYVSDGETGDMSLFLVLSPADFRA